MDVCLLRANAHQQGCSAKRATLDLDLFLFQVYLLNPVLLLFQSSGEDILASLRVLEAALRESPVDGPEGPGGSGPLLQECLYYLNTYGTHLALIRFHVRRGGLTEALTYLLSRVSGARHIRPDVWVTGPP